MFPNTSKSPGLNEPNTLLPLYSSKNSSKFSYLKKLYHNIINIHINLSVILSYIGLIISFLLLYFGWIHSSWRYQYTLIECNDIGCLITLYRNYRATEFDEIKYNDLIIEDWFKNGPPNWNKKNNLNIDNYYDTNGVLLPYWPNDYPIQLYFERNNLKGSNMIRIDRIGNQMDINNLSRKSQRKLGYSYMLTLDHGPEIIYNEETNQLYTLDEITNNNEGKTNKFLEETAIQMVRFNLGRRRAKIQENKIKRWLREGNKDIELVDKLGWTWSSFALTLFGCLSLFFMAFAGIYKNPPPRRKIN